MNQVQHKSNGAALPMESRVPVVSSERQGIETLLTAREVAAHLQVSPSWVREHAGPSGRRPQIKCVQLGSMVRFRPADVASFILEWCR